MIAVLLAVTILHSSVQALTGGAEPFVPPVQAGSTVPDATFVDQNGRTRSWRDFRGHTTVLSFMYTRCRDAHVCPLVSAKFAAMQQLLPPNARMIEFTLDPAYDRPMILKRYGAMFGQRDPPWTLATGDQEMMRRIATQFGVGVTSHRRDTINHGEALVILNRDGTLRTVVEGDAWEPMEVVAEVNDAEGMGSSALLRLVLTIRGSLASAARVCGLIGNDGHLRPLVMFLQGAGLIILTVVCVEVVRSLGFRYRRERHKA